MWFLVGIPTSDGSDHRNSELGFWNCRNSEFRSQSVGIPSFSEKNPRNSEAGSQIFGIPTSNFRLSYSCWNSRNSEVNSEGNASLRLLSVGTKLIVCMWLLKWSSRMYLYCLQSTLSISLLLLLLDILVSCGEVNVGELNGTVCLILRATCYRTVTKKSPLFEPLYLNILSNENGHFGVCWYCLDIFFQNLPSKNSYLTSLQRYMNLSI